MERVIPKKTHVKIEFFKNVTIGDFIYAAIVLGIGLAFFISNFDYHTYVSLAWLAVGVSMFFPVEDGIRIYSFLGLIFRFFAFKKKFSKQEKKGFTKITELVPFVNIVQNKFIDYVTYKAMVIEVNPISFGLFTEEKQNLIIGTFANALRRLNQDQAASIVKLSKALILDDYIEYEEQKFEVVQKMVEAQQFTQEEVESRTGVFEARVNAMDYVNKTEKQYKDHFYIVVYDKDRDALQTTTDGIIATMKQSVMPIYSQALNGRELASFLRATYGKDFNERELNDLTEDQYKTWAMPNDVLFRMGSTDIDGQTYKMFTVSDYPLYVGNAWGASLFLLDRTNVIMNINPVPKYDSERSIDKSIMETETKLERSGKSSTQIELQTHIDTLRSLLQDLKNNNEILYDCNIHIMCEDAVKKDVRAILKQNGFRYSEMFGRQVDAFVSTEISLRDTIKEYKRSIPTTTLAAVFPFISSSLQDPKGFYLGYNEYSVFLNPFLRNSERVNSNAIIIGKSGSGKSFATKTILSNLAADNTKIFILDPEEEYLGLAKNLHGKMMDVGSSTHGILNPFHIMTTLEAEEGEHDDSFALHLQFLEQFFKIILPGMSSDCFELLNSTVTDVYKRKNIDGNTDLKPLKPEDFPIFDDLYAVITDKIKTEKDPYRKQNYQVIQTYVEKFAKGGRNSNLWDGPTSIVTNENFVSFNFRTLLANRNQTIASAQMLLIFKYLDNEIIRNRDFNLKYHTNRHIIVVVDEAHVFINPNYPIALDFMVNMAKRIRKYGGMQIIITQNIKDFVGSPEIARQSTAIINASQYSFIFSLAPNDMTDLVELYRNAGGINESEQDSIVTAGVGQCFLITGPLSRTSLKIDPLPYVAQLFKE
jgi:conjugal transfer ATP-binding protein TraC